MARMEDSLYQVFKGRVGGVVGSNWKGIKILKSKGPSTRKNDSPAQLEQQAKFRRAMRFVRRMSRLFKITYKNYAQQKTARNSALAVTITQAITGVYPNFDLDYSKVMISRGTLDNETSTLSVAGGVLTWTWAHEASYLFDNRDKAIIVAYCPEIDRALYQVSTAMRSSNQVTMSVTPFMGKPVVTWIAFISDDLTQLSDSQYTGQVTVV